MHFALEKQRSSVWRIHDAMVKLSKGVRFQKFPRTSHLFTHSSSPRFDCQAVAFGNTNLSIWHALAKSPTDLPSIVEHLLRDHMLHSISMHFLLFDVVMMLSWCCLSITGMAMYGNAWRVFGDAAIWRNISRSRINCSTCMRSICLKDAWSTGAYECLGLYMPL